MSITLLEAERLFDYADSMYKSDGTITKSELIKACGVDLDLDGETTNKKLYRKREQAGIGKYSGKPIYKYVYRTDAHAGFDPYMIEDAGGVLVHATETMIAMKTGNAWLKDFDTDPADMVITRKEFMTRLGFA